MRHFQHLSVLLAAWGGATLGPLAHGSWTPEGYSNWLSTEDALYFDGEVIPWPSLEGHIPVADALDIHPELKSRARLWADLDGSFLVDPNNAAEMRDFTFTVIRGAVYDHEWSGSYEPFDPGTISPVWRQREYAQVNAYRAIVGLSALEESPQWLPILQAGAAFLNQDDVVFQHRPAPDAGPNWSVLAWHGTRANLSGGGEPAGRTAADGWSRATDGQIQDGGANNKAVVGHRSSILSPRATSVTLGYAARGGYYDDWAIATLRVSDDTSFAPTADEQEVKFIKWPSDGYFPMELLGSSPPNDGLRWSFWVNRSWDGPFANPAMPGAAVTLTHATVSATVNGRAVAIGDRRNAPLGGIMTWDIANRDLGIDDTVWPTIWPPEVQTVVVTINNIQYQGAALSHTYTVKFAPPAFEVPEALPTPTGSFANLSTRGRIGRGDQSLIAGLIVEGEAPVKVVFRAQGPGLTQYGITDPARDLRMELFQQTAGGGQSLGSNQGWREGAHWRLIDSYETLAPSDDREPALAATLWPGAYTVVVTAGQEGVGIVEAFNVDAHSLATFGNLSTRGLVGSGENQMIAGIVLTRPTRVLIRAQGPSLAAFGVTDALADPILQLRLGTEVLAENRYWQDDPGNAELMNGGPLAIYAPGDHREAALVKQLPAGVYTAQVSTSGEPGVGIVEVFALD